jgi:hypothetical protein
VSVYPYVMPVDEFGRKWPELALPNHKVWLCDKCGQPEIKGKCSHQKMKPETVKKLGGKL